jgi:Zn-dependent protease
MTCFQCGAQLPPNLLACPSCHSLVHAAELKSLAGKADAAATTGNITEALVHWRRALDLLPEASAQHSAVKQKIAQLGHRLDAAPDAKTAPAKPKWAAAGGTIGVIGLLLWKFKFVVVFLLTKAKILLLGLTKMSTLFSMLLWVVVYWQLWGWKFALGMGIAIYIHEMGHIYQLGRYGIPATAPMFIPGFGALIRVKQYPVTPHENAVTGLAGPVWGLGATIAAYLLHLATGSERFAALAKLNSWINLFNLLPVWQLDGSHAFRALTKWERAGVAAVAAGMGIAVQEGMLLLIAIVAGFRVFQKDAAQKTDARIFWEFIFLIVTLTLFSQIEVAIPRNQP